MSSSKRSSKKDQSTRKLKEEPDPEIVEESPFEGTGLFYHHEETTYEGMWRKENGVVERHGKGVWRDCGNTFEGEFLNDAFHGFGVFNYKSGAKYEGEWVAGKYHGHGKYSWPDKSEYNGEWRTNMMHGEGTYTDANGDMWRGTFYANAGPGLNPFIK